MDKNTSVPNKILLVDDDTNLIEGIQRFFHKRFDIDTAPGGSEGLQKMAAEGPYAVVIADMRMPAMSGLEFLKEVQKQAPDTIRMMLTGNADLATAVAAVNDGRVFRYLNKPCPPPNLAPAIEAGLEQYRLIFAERQLLENTLGGAVKILTEILSVFDPATFGCSSRLRYYIHDFMLSTSPTGLWEFEMAAMLSQIGRVTIPPGLIDKERQGRPLAENEKNLLNQIPELGARLIENIPRLDTVARIIRYQKKHFDGTGCPADSLSGDKIPLGSRVLKVLMDFVALEASEGSRPLALQVMRERIGWYDLEVLAAVSRWCDVALDNPPAIQSNVQSVRIENLRVGDALAQDVRIQGDILIVAANARLTPVMLEKLRNFRQLATIDQFVLVYSG